MAEETKTTASEAPAAEVVVSDVAQKVVVEKEATVTTGTPEPEPAPVPEPEKPAEEPAAAAAEEAEKAGEEKITESASFKEETNVVGELPDPQKKAIEELKQLVRDALNKHEFTAPPPPPAPATEEQLI